MASDRWLRAKEIFRAAIDLDPSRREVYVREAARRDPELLAEVMSLLEKDSSAAFFKNPIEQPSDGATLLEGRYRLETELGRGGFGVVYLARDQQLHDRRVVIKMPMIQSPTDTWPSEKFEQEIKALVDEAAIKWQPAAFDDGLIGGFVTNTLLMRSVLQGASNSLSAWKRP